MKTSNTSGEEEKNIPLAVFDRFDTRICPQTTEKFTGFIYIKPSCVTLQFCLMYISDDDDDGGDSADDCPFVLRWKLPSTACLWYRLGDINKWVGSSKSSLNKHKQRRDRVEEGGCRDSCGSGGGGGGGNRSGNKTKSLTIEKISATDA